MGIDDLKQYSVIVGGGSGVLFQPMNNNEYTYILSAKHNFYTDIKCEELRKNIPIEIINHSIDKLKSFEIKEGENYFPHEEADIAIIKIDPLDGFERIITESDDENLEDVLLCGFPCDYRKAKEKIGEQFSNVQVERFIVRNDFYVRAELNRQYDDQPRIVGYSGGGLLKYDNDYISIIGIQSEVTSSLPNGQIEFVPIKFFTEIIEYPKNNGKLALLLPQYMISFERIKNEIFELEDAIAPQFKSKIRSAFYSRMCLIDISPLDLYTSKYRDYLLINNKSKTPLLRKEIWKAWLEYLLILSFIIDKKINIDQVDSIFNDKRLMHSDSEDSFIDIIPQLILKSDLTGLKDDGILIISTKTCPNKRRRVNSGMLKNIFDARSQILEMKIDHASKIKRIKEIIHIKAFQLDCIIENETSLNHHSICDVEELITDLKIKFHEFLECTN